MEENKKKVRSMNYAEITYRLIEENKQLILKVDRLERELEEYKKICVSSEARNTERRT